MSIITGFINCQLCFIILRTAVSITKWNSSENGVHITMHWQSRELIVIDWVKVLHPIAHKLGHFRDIPQINLLPSHGKTKPNRTKAHIHQTKEMYYNQNKHKKKLKSGLVTSYNIRPANGEVLFLFRHFKNLSFTYLLRHLPTYLLTADESAVKWLTSHRTWSIRQQQQLTYCPGTRTGQN